MPQTTPPPHPATGAPGPPRVLHATAVVAAIGTVLALVGLALLLRPVQTPVQDCGTVAGFLLDGRTNELVDPANPPKGITRAEAEANNREPCRDRVADAAKPGAAIFVLGLVTATVAAAIELGVRGALWRRRRAARRRPTTEPAPAPAPGEPAGAATP